MYNNAGTKSSQLSESSLFQNVFERLEKQLQLMHENVDMIRSKCSDLAPFEPHPKAMAKEDFSSGIIGRVQKYLSDMGTINEELVDISAHLKRIV